MPKLQQIKRRKRNDSIVSSINIPLSIIEALGWKKGDEIMIELVSENRIMMYRIGGG